MSPRKPSMASMMVWVAIKLYQLYGWFRKKMTEPDSVFPEVVFVVVLLAISFWLIFEHRGIP